MNEPTPTTDDVCLAYAENITLHLMEEPALSEANGQFYRWRAVCDAEAAGKQAQLDVQIAEAMSTNAEPNADENDYEAGVRHGADAIAAAIRTQLGEAWQEPEWEYGIEYAPGRYEFEGATLVQIQDRVRFIRNADGHPYALTVKVLRRTPAGAPQEFSIV